MWFIALSAFSIAFICASPAFAAMDPLCQSLQSIELNAAKTPFHLYLTSEHKFQSQTFARAGAQLGMTGPKKSEEISTGKDVYVLQDGKWIDMKTNFTDMSKGDANDPDIKKAREAARCHMLPDAMVAGQPASVYEEDNAENGTVAKMWISKINHLPLKSEIATDSGVMKSLTTATYEYKNAAAPAGAITMQQMMGLKHH